MKAIVIYSWFISCFNLLGKEVVDVGGTECVWRHGRGSGRYPSPLQDISKALAEFDSIVGINRQSWCCISCLRFKVFFILICASHVVTVTKENIDDILKVWWWKKVASALASSVAESVVVRSWGSWGVLAAMAGLDCCVCWPSTTNKVATLRITTVIKKLLPTRYRNTCQVEGLVNKNLYRRQWSAEDVGKKESYQLDKCVCSLSKNIDIN